jgi:acetoacetyl-CoA synthetase
MAIHSTFVVTGLLQKPAKKETYMRSIAAPASVRSVTEGERLWTPSAEFVEASQLAQFARWLEQNRNLAFASYADMWRWSVTDLDAFWAAVWDYFVVDSSTPPTAVHIGEMPRTRWFPGCRINFAEHLLRYERRAAIGEIVIVHSSELRPLQEISWQELGDSVRRFATYLRGAGVVPGDRVVAYMPNVPEAAIAMMATTAIGAVWSSAAPEFGVQAVLDRFAQIEPKILVTVDGYRFGGRDFDRSADVETIAAGLPTLERIVWLPYLNTGAKNPTRLTSVEWKEALSCSGVTRDDFAYERVGEDHPLWILFSSGTTGLPKAIVHSQVGITLEMLKLTALSANLTPTSRMFFYTSTGWMMWNFLISGLLQGASIVLYDGHPAAPQVDALWQLAETCEVTLFGCSPGYAQQMQKLGLVPKDMFDLRRLDTIFLTGSPATPETFAWFYNCVKPELWVTSQSGGTDFCSVLVGAVATRAIYAGEIQGCNLGMDVHAWNESGRDVIDEVGELVVTSPAPSMPLYFWNDPGGERYRDSYFSTYPGVWRHGDFIKITRRGGVYVYGRSDSTLNRFGERIGTAEIYRCIERLGDIVDSLIVCIDTPNGGFYMPLFVKLAPGRSLDGRTYDRILRQLRHDCSPRHVPDEIHAVPDIPYTLSAKKMEIPVRRILQGMPADRVAARDTMRNPDSIDWFVCFRNSIRARITAGERGARRSAGQVRRAVRSRVPNSALAQNDNIVSVVSNVWSEVLGAEFYEHNDRLDDAGGDSLSMIQLAYRIERLLGEPISLEVMWSAMRPSDLIERLNDRRVRVSAPALNDPTVIFLPGLGGDEPKLVQFRRTFGDDVRFFVPSYPPWDALVTGDVSFSGVVNDVIDQIRQNVNYRPLILIGYSFGGFIVHEVARQLLDAGDAIAFIGVLDSYFPSQEETADPLRWLGGLARQIRDQGIANAVATRAGHLLAKVVYRSRTLLRTAARHSRRLPLPTKIAFSFDYSMTDLVRAGLTKTWNPGTLSASTTLFRSQSHGADAAHDLCWGRYSPSLRVENVDGTHESMIAGPNGNRLALKIRQELAPYL